MQTKHSKDPRRDGRQAPVGPGEDCPHSSTMVAARVKQVEPVTFVRQFDQQTCQCHLRAGDSQLGDNPKC